MKLKKRNNRNSYKKNRHYNLKNKSLKNKRKRKRKRTKEKIVIGGGFLDRIRNLGRKRKSKRPAVKTLSDTNNLTRIIYDQKYKYILTLKDKKFIVKRELLNKETDDENDYENKQGLSKPQGSVENRLTEIEKMLKELLGRDVSPSSEHSSDLTSYKQLKRILVGADVNRNITQFDNLKKHLDPIGKGLFDFEKGSLAEFFHSIPNYGEEKKVEKEEVDAKAKALSLQSSVAKASPPAKTLSLQTPSSSSALSSSTLSSQSSVVLPAKTKAPAPVKPLAEAQVTVEKTEKAPAPAKPLAVSPQQSVAEAPVKPLAEAEVATKLEVDAPQPLLTQQPLLTPTEILLQPVLTSELEKKAGDKDEGEETASQTTTEVSADAEGKPPTDVGDAAVETGDATASSSVDTKEKPSAKAETTEVESTEKKKPPQPEKVEGKDAPPPPPPPPKKKGKTTASTDATATATAKKKGEKRQKERRRRKTKIIEKTPKRKKIKK